MQPLFTPPHPEQTHLHQFGLQLARAYNFPYNSYQDLHRFSVENMAEFWHFFVKYHGIIGEFPDEADAVISDDTRMAAKQFFPDATLNYAENLLQFSPDESDNPAIIFTDGFQEHIISWQNLADEVSRLQQALKQSGFGAGDIAAGFLPNAPIAVMAMLAVTSLGGVWSSCSPDFGAQGVMDRFGQIRPKILFTSDGYRYNGKTHQALERVVPYVKDIDSIEQIIVAPLTAEASAINLPICENFAVRGLDEFLQPFTPQTLEFVRRNFNDPLFILFSSGTTGIPKCIIHGIGGSLVNFIKEHRLHCDLRRGDRVFYYTTCGWMMWNWLSAALASGCCLLLYDESPLHPHAQILFDYIAKHRARFMGISAKYIDALAKQQLDVSRSHDLQHLQMIGSTGSVLSPEAFDYISQNIKADMSINSLSGGTDIVGCFVMGVPTSPVYRGEITGAALGMKIEVFNDAGKPTMCGEKGELVCAKPFPNMPIGFFNDADGKKYHQAYFARFANIWHHGDFIARTEHGGFIIYGRSDATLNPGGVRIGTAEIYRTVENLPEIQESICVGQDFVGDVRVLLFVVLMPNHSLTQELEQKIKQAIKTNCTPRHVPAKILAVQIIPRTRSGKITELAVRDIVNGKEVKNLTALANPESLDEYERLTKNHLQDS